MEHLFLAYLESTINAENASACVVTKDDVNPVFVPRLNACTVTRCCVKRWGGVKLPPLALVRQRNIARIVAAERPDRVVLWSTLPTSAWEIACRRTGSELVYYDHGKAWGISPDEGRTAFARVRTAIAVSHAGRRILQERHGFDGPVAVAPNGLRFTRVPQSPERPLGNELQIGFAGRLVDHKGVPVLLAAATDLVRRGIGFHLHVAGSGPEESALRGLSAHYGLGSRVTFHGDLDDMPDFYRSIDVLAMPSLREPFGLGSIEAAAFGAVPVVARVDGLAETVCHGETGLALPVTGSLDLYRRLGGHARDLPQQVYDPDSDALRTPGIVEPRLLADALADLAGNPAKVSCMGAAAAELVRTRFSHERFVERLNGLLYTP